MDRAQQVRVSVTTTFRFVDGASRQLCLEQLAAVALRRRPVSHSEIQL